MTDYLKATKLFLKLLSNSDKERLLAHILEYQIKHEYEGDEVPVSAEQMSSKLYEWYIAIAKGTR